MTPKKYMLVSITDRPHTDIEYPNALFVYEENNKIFREAKFAFVISTGISNSRDFVPARSRIVAKNNNFM